MDGLGGAATRRVRDANGLPHDSSEALALKARAFSLHKTLGISVFLVALARIGWALSQPKPALLNAERKLESLAAETVHWLLYGSLVLVPLTGWIHHASTAGFAPIWWPFGQDLPFVPKSETLAAATAGLHIVFERVLAASVLLHIAGAMKHHLVDKDNTLRRMLPGQPALPDLAATTHRTILPLAMAVAIWGAALGIGLALDVHVRHGETVQAAALKDVQSDWTVQTGEIEIVVQQLGSAVSGRFADWTASISFDETVSQGVAGSVDVTVSVGSLTLGSVTTHALGSDFFNATAFPTARYTAEILRGPEGYTAVGNLTIKEQSVPVRLPFTLDISNGAAVMKGNTALDRREFAIGTTSQPGEGSLGFGVGVNISLTAAEAN